MMVTWPNCDLFYSLLTRFQHDVNRNTGTVIIHIWEINDFARTLNTPIKTKTNETEETKWWFWCVFLLRNVLNFFGDIFFLSYFYQAIIKRLLQLKSVSFNSLIDGYTKAHTPKLTHMWLHTFAHCSGTPLKMIERLLSFPLCSYSREHLIVTVQNGVGPFQKLNVIITLLGLMQVVFFFFFSLLRMSFKLYCFELSLSKWFSPCLSFNH